MKSILLLTALALSSPILAAPATASPATRGVAGPTTHLTLRVADCEGCVVGVASYLQGSVDAWAGRPRKVVDGKVAFDVPTDRTQGLSITVRAPWEGATGYVTNVAFRYRGYQVGDRVFLAGARASTRASGCWAGTSERAVSMKVKVRRVMVDGNGGKVPGTIAWTAVTRPWLRPMVTTWHGVVGTQDVMPCRE